MAVEKKELPQLEKLYQRGLENGVKDLKILDSKEIKDIEPYCEVRISLGLKGVVFICPQTIYFLLRLKANGRISKNAKGARSPSGKKIKNSFWPVLR